MKKSELVKIVRTVVRSELKPLREEMERKFISLMVETLAEEKALRKVEAPKRAKKVVLEEEDIDMLGDMLPPTRKVNSKLPRTKVPENTAQVTDMVRKSVMGESANPYEDFTEDTPVTMENLMNTAVDEEALMFDRQQREMEILDSTTPQELEEVGETDIGGLENVNYSAFLGDEKVVSEEDESVEEQRREILNKGPTPQIQVVG